MSEIPAEIMEEARNVVDNMTGDPITLRSYEMLIARFLLAAEQRGAEREREACAKAALAYSFTDEGQQHSNMAVAINASQAIAAAIRSRGEG